ncbi:MAG: M20/M25/M40 family metallo-hydrolase [Anaerolineae bacterium]|nr:M20/M25/M40 family metallo-hydrolase [Anaerolineae bacterium]
MKKNWFFFCVLLAILVLSACNYPQPDSPEPCGSKRLVRDMLSQTQSSSYAGWISDLSGARPVFLDGQPVTISTRFSYAMFSGQANARAFDYVLSLAQSWFSPRQIEVLPYPYQDAERTNTWKNLMITIPGSTRPDEVVYLTAHLDSILSHDGDPMLIAPGADDNASGDAALLEALRILRYYQFDRTIKVVFFSGEEEFAAGSRQFVAAGLPGQTVGVINLDMLAFQKDEQAIVQLHTGSLPASQEISNCFIQTVQSYKLNLIPQVFTSTASLRSDHASFWAYNIPAIWVFDGLDENGNFYYPYYHRPSDTIDRLNLDYGFNNAKAALATTASLAGTQRKCNRQQFDLRVTPVNGQVNLDWNALSGVDTYRILRSETGCDSGWILTAEVNTTHWEDTSVSPGKTYRYRVEAAAGAQAGYCISAVSSCQAVTP